MNQFKIVRSVAVATAVVLLLGACDASITFGDGLEGSGELVTQRFELDDFDSIDVSSTFDVQITVGEESFVEILADENLIDELDIRVRNGTLRVGVRTGVSIRSGTLEATVRVPELNSLDVSGASQVAVEGSSGSSQSFDISGSSELDATGVTGALTIDASGSSDVRMSGTATDVTLDASGASDLMFNLTNVEWARVDLSGASSVEFGSLGSVSGDLSGASDLTIPAGTEATVDTSGASTIHRR